jgi:ribose transport system permease protein
MSLNMNAHRSDSQPQGAPSLPRTSGSSRLVGLLRDYAGILGMLIAAIVLFTIKPAIAAPANLAGIIDQSSALVIMSMGMAIAMSMRGVDLTIAQLADATGLIAAWLLVHGYPPVAVLVIPLAFGLLVGVINGVLMSYLGVPAIIGTLGMMFIIRTTELVLSNTREPQILFTLPASETDAFFFIGQGRIGPIPVEVILAIIIVVIAYLMTRRSTLGRFWDAIGGSARASYLAGVNVRRVFAWGFVISALMATIGGVTVASRAGIAAPGSVETMLLDTFVAVYLGSVVSKAGRITILGTVVGALFVGLIGNALTVLGLGAAARYLVYGSILLLAMTVGRIRRVQS